MIGSGFGLSSACRNSEVFGFGEACGLTETSDSTKASDNLQPSAFRKVSETAKHTAMSDSDTAIPDDLPDCRPDIIGMVWKLDHEKDMLQFFFFFFFL
jgi:hypothetical protein